jgi:hypothetical protein
MHSTKEFKKVDIVDYVNNNFVKTDYIKAYHFKKAYKFKKVKARQGVIGEKVLTMMKNGLVETTNKVKVDKQTNKLDWIITNVSGEQYVIAYKTFYKKYEQTPDKNGFYKPKPIKVTVVELKENVSFMAPWGEFMHIANGGYLVVDNPNDIYGIQKEEFFNTYKIVQK